MITVTPTRDVDFINSVMRSPGIYAGLADDSCPKLDNFDMAVALEIPGCLFLQILDDGAPSGWFMLLPKGGEVLEVHTATLASCRGKKAVRAALAAEEWIFTNTPCAEITSYALSDSKQTVVFALLSGLSITGRKPHDATRNGKPVDIITLSISKDDWKSNHK